MDKEVRVALAQQALDSANMDTQLAATLVALEKKIALQQHQIEAVYNLVLAQGTVQELLEKRLSQLDGVILPD